MQTKEDLIKVLDEVNIAESLPKEELDKFGLKVIEWFDIDEESRREWKERVDSYLKLATQVMENKSFPWPNAANVKFPLLATAALQFAARAYPALVPGPNLVAGLVVGRDEGGQKQESAERVGRHLSYQLMFEMPDWEEEMDKLCFILPIVGCLFKKTYYDPLEQRNCSELIMPGDLVVDYYATSLEKAYRKSQVVWRTMNQIVERENKGLFLPLTYTDPIPSPPNAAKDAINGTKEPQVTPGTPHRFIECHCSWDIDGDGYEEPYIVTVHYESRQIVRIAPRFDADSIETEIDDATGKEKLVRIVPIEYFTKFGFIPNPDGSIYDLGFGLLLGGINESVNTLTNQLLDSGTLNNLQAGFLGRGIRVRGGSARFIPGEWKSVDFTGDDIKRHIFPLPTKEPSDVLFKLLEALVTSGKELASIAEIFVGKMPGQNTPATTTMATIEQGLKVFTAIHKRLYRALNKEYAKLFRLNSAYLPNETTYFTITEPQGNTQQQVIKTDYDKKNIGVKPNADPNIVSSAQKLMKVQSYGSLLQLGTLNPQEYTKRYLEAVEAENASALMGDGKGGPYQPPPSPEQQKLQGEMQGKQADAKIKEGEAQQKAQLEQQKGQLAQMKAALDAKDKEMEMRIKMFEAQLAEREAQMKLMTMAKEHQLKTQIAADEHQQSMQHTQQEHQQNLQTQKELGAAKVKQANQPKPAPKGK